MKPSSLAYRPSTLLLAERQDVAAEAFRAGGQEVHGVGLETGPGLADGGDVLAQVVVGLVSELHETDFLQGVVSVADGFVGDAVAHKVVVVWVGLRRAGPGLFG